MYHAKSLLLQSYRHWCAQAHISHLYKKVERLLADQMADSIPLVIAQYPPATIGGRPISHEKSNVIFIWE
jgi:hypothetical protein